MNILAKKHDGEIEIVDAEKYISEAFYSLMPFADLDVKYDFDPDFDPESGITFLCLRARYYYKGEQKHMGATFAWDIIRRYDNQIDYCGGCVKDFYNYILAETEKGDKHDRISLQRFE